MSNANMNYFNIEYFYGIRAITFISYSMNLHPLIKRKVKSCLFLLFKS